MNLEAWFTLHVGSSRRPSVVGLAIILLCPLALIAQAAATAAPSSAQETASIDQYIHHAWDTLSRSMTDCASFTETKLKVAPVLYLPVEVAEPADVQAFVAHCHVHVEHLSRRITHIGDIDPRSMKVQGLLYLPNKYVVPGGRFNEMYGWESYFILLGLLKDGRVDFARGMVENFFFEIEHYGSILNANRTYYLTRSQPPFLSSMIRDVYDAESDRKKADAWLATAYDSAVKDHALWTSDIHQVGDTGLAHYFDLGVGPVPEEDDDTTYYSDVIRWLLAHPDVKTDFLVEAPDQPNAADQARLAQTSCDVRISKVCSRAHVDGRWLSKDYYRGDRAMRESGYDPSFRFGPFSGATHLYALVCLNSLLYKYERDLAWMAEKLGKHDEIKQWNEAAEARKAAIDKYLWNASENFDYGCTTQRQSTYRYLTMFYPLWAGLADENQIKGLEKALRWFEQQGGLAMSTYNSGTQWDLPYGWAPTSWLAIAGLQKVGNTQDARRVSEKFSRTIATNFEHDHTIREKYDVVQGTSEMNLATGYKTNEVGFGWTNAVYLKMQQVIADTGGN